MSGFGMFGEITTPDARRVARATAVAVVHGVRLLTKWVDSNPGMTKRQVSSGLKQMQKDRDSETEDALLDIMRHDLDVESVELGREIAHFALFYAAQIVLENRGIVS